MRTISIWLCMVAFVAFTSGVARAQDDAMQQQLDKLSGQIQDMLAAQALQMKRLDALEKQVADLQTKLNQPDAVASASAEDLKKLAAQVQEIDKKRQDDRDLILKEIEKLGKVSGSSGAKTSVSHDTATSSDGKQKGYNYEIHSGDTLSAIAKAYGDQGIKISVEQILKANPKLDPKSMKVGQTIFIPAP